MGSTKYASSNAKYFSQEADMAIVDLSITAERMEVVDFTQPFLRTGISILFRRQQQQTDVSYFLFMKPFSLEVWICTLTAFIGSYLSKMNLLHGIYYWFDGIS